MQTTTKTRNTKSAEPETYIEKQQEEKSSTSVPVLCFGPFSWPLLSPRYSQQHKQLQQQSNVVTNENALTLHNFTILHSFFPQSQNTSLFSQLKPHTPFILSFSFT